MKRRAREVGHAARRERRAPKSQAKGRGEHVQARRQLSRGVDTRDRPEWTAGPVRIRRRSVPEREVAEHRQLLVEFQGGVEEPEQHGERGAFGTAADRGVRLILPFPSSRLVGPRRRGGFQKRNPKRVSPRRQRRRLRRRGSVAHEVVKQRRGEPCLLHLVHGDAVGANQHRRELPHRGGVAGRDGGGCQREPVGGDARRPGRAVPRLERRSRVVEGLPGHRVHLLLLSRGAGDPTAGRRRTRRRLQRGAERRRGSPPRTRPTLLFAIRGTLRCELLDPAQQTVPTKLSRVARV